MNTYHSIHVLGVSRGDVHAGLDNYFYRRYYSRCQVQQATAETWNLAVSDVSGGWVSVFDEGKNFRRAHRIAKALSAYTHAPTLWLGLFEDLDFFYQLFYDGKIIDAYDSDPSVFDPEEGFTDQPNGIEWLPADFSDLNPNRDIAVLGNPPVFFSVFSGHDEGEPKRLQSLLSRGRAFHGEGLQPEDELSWLEDGLPAFSELLGLDPERTTTGFDRLLEQESLPSWLERVSFQPLPKAERVNRPPKSKRPREAS